MANHILPMYHAQKMASTSIANRLTYQLPYHLLSNAGAYTTVAYATLAPSHAERTLKRGRELVEYGASTVTQLFSSEPPSKRARLFGPNRPSGPFTMTRSWSMKKKFGHI